MGKIFFRRLAAVMVALWVSAAAAYPMQAAEVTDEEKAYIAGSLLTDVIDLIMESYAGPPVTVEELYEAALYGMTELLDDYSVYLDESDLSELTGSLSGNLTGIGVVLHLNEAEQPEVLRVLPESPALEAGLHKNDIITAINGVTLNGQTLDEVISLITDPEVTRVVLKVKRGKNTMTFSMNKREITTTTVYTSRIEEILGASAAEAGKHYRYVSVNMIGKTTADELRKTITALKNEGVKGIVLDMRGNSGGYLDVAIDICKQIVPKGPIVHTVSANETKVTYNSTLATRPFVKMVVLVDRDTASAAELITAALQDAKAAVVVGENTFGKGVIQTLYPLVTGGGLKMTTEEYLRRSGEQINQIGVIPDHEIVRNYMDYETENDEGLSLAFALLCE